jgi:primosomal protein N' (replication factor Y) (superfamily II helicase)
MTLNKNKNSEISSLDSSRIVQILVPNLDPLDYLIADDLNIQLGDLVIVPFRNQKLLGMAWKVKNESDIPVNKLRFIEQLTPLSLQKTDLKFMQWIADYYLFNLGHIFKMVIPSQIASNILKGKTSKAAAQLSYPEYIEPTFNLEQIDAIKQISQLIENKQHNIILDGVTGSGKTEIYLAAIDLILRKDPKAQILIMLPEIVLTSQIVDRINNRFNYKPYIWHSNITEKQRRESFSSIMDSTARIIVGARSAVFLPYKNLSMIIVDEEHEQSYKQEEGVTYQARDMAIMRAKLANIPILLASASPSLETIYNISLGKVNLVSLTGRYNHNEMPKINIIDMRKERRKNHFISPVLLEAIKANLAKDQQSLLFLNRKGYSPAMICSQCGHKSCCKSCSTGMVYHKAQKKLKCHQCGYVAALPKTCPHCAQEDSFIPCGPGVERLSEELQTLIPNARILTLTQDSFSKPKETEALLASITNKEIDIIIGTQIIAKGHHFPALTLVGIIDADSGMMGGDLRAAEKTYQLLQQVGGRAGREIANGQIFIQTYNPEHPLILALSSYNRQKFIEEEMNTRKAMHMPPFGRLAAVIISSTQEKKLIDFSKELVRVAPITKEIQILGPAPALIYKIRGKFRYRVLIKTKRNINIQKYFNAWIENLKVPSHVHMKIDIDPYYFL